MTRYPETQDGDTSQQVCCLAGWQLWEMQMSCLRVVMEAEACVGPKGQVGERNRVGEGELGWEWLREG